MRFEFSKKEPSSPTNDTCYLIRDELTEKLSIVIFDSNGVRSELKDTLGGQSAFDFEPLASGTDLNNVKISGKFAINTTDILNWPGGDGYLTVETSGQDVIQYASIIGTSRILKRSCVNNVWESTWRDTGEIEGIVPLANGGTGTTTVEGIRQRLGINSGPVTATSLSDLLNKLSLKGPGFYYSTTDIGVIKANCPIIFSKHYDTYSLIHTNVSTGSLDTLSGVLNKDTLIPTSILQNRLITENMPDNGVFSLYTNKNFTVPVGFKGWVEILRIPPSNYPIQQKFHLFCYQAHTAIEIDFNKSVHEGSNKSVGIKYECLCYYSYKFLVPIKLRVLDGGTKQKVALQIYFDNFSNSSANWNLISRGQIRLIVGDNIKPIEDIVFNPVFDQGYINYNCINLFHTETNLTHLPIREANLFVGIPNVRYVKNDNIEANMTALTE